jgi:peptide deformylase
MTNLPAPVRRLQRPGSCCGSRKAAAPTKKAVVSRRRPVDPSAPFAYLKSMAILDIIRAPDPLLRRPSSPVERIDADLKRLVHDMLTTMYKAPGVGLAAVQVGVPRRLLVMDIVKNDTDPKNPIAMLNPEIVEVIGTDMRMHEEGCLSIPDIYAELERHSKVRVSYMDMTGKQTEMICADMLATVVQHEIDHLNGKLFIDHLSKLKRDIIIKKMIKAKRDEEMVG